MFVMDCYGHKLSNGVLFAYHLILDVPGGSSHLGYRRRVPLGHNPTTRVKNPFMMEVRISRILAPAYGYQPHHKRFKERHSYISNCLLTFFE